jgi:hypothetical protein
MPTWINTRLRRGSFCRALALGLVATAGGAGCHYKVVAFSAIDPRAAERVIGAVVGIRGLAPREPIHFQIVPRAVLRREIEADLGRMKVDGTLALWRKAWTRLGLLSPADDLERALADLYGEEPLGWYDDQARRLRVVVADRIRTEVTELYGLIRRRDPVYGEALAHEAVHALCDQRFHLAELLRTRDEDTRLARRALVEGDATKAGYEYAGFGSADFAAHAQHLSARRDTLDAGDRSPRWLRETFRFPYLDGALFVARLHARGGWAAVDAAYADPPRSSEQILHPEKYLDKPRDDPRPVPERLAPPTGWRSIYSLTLGELGVDVLLGRGAGLGWGGDHAEVWEDEHGDLGMVWATVWDDEAAAARFAAAYRARVGGGGEPLAIERRGMRVGVVRGLGGEAGAAALAETLR